MADNPSYFDGIKDLNIAVEKSKKKNCLSLKDARSFQFGRASAPIAPCNDDGRSRRTHRMGNSPMAASFKCGATA